MNPNTPLALCGCLYYKNKTQLKQNCGAKRERGREGKSMQKRPSLEEQKWERVWGKKRGGSPIPPSLYFSPTSSIVCVSAFFEHKREARPGEKK
jgi:hypothetical protein